MPVPWDARCDSDDPLDGLGDQNDCDVATLEAMMHGIEAGDFNYVDAIVVGVGSSGTLTGLTRYFRKTQPKLEFVLADPQGSILTEYIDTGKVRFIHREVYFDRFGLWAGMVARCGGEDRYFGVADIVYNTQSEWTKGGDPATIVENLRRIGRTAGLTDEQLDACLSDADKARQEPARGRLWHNPAPSKYEAIASMRGR